MFWTGEGEDVVVNAAILAVPLHPKTLLATLGVPGESLVAEAEPLHVSRLLDEVDDPGGVQRSEVTVLSAYAYCRTDRHRHVRRE
jgi:hypothetical protein